jgi:hypothetical protein
MRRDIARAVGASLSHARAFLRRELAAANMGFEIRAAELGAERDEALAQRDQAMQNLRELLDAVAARQQAHAELTAYYRARTIARATAAVRDESMPLQ